MYHCWLAKVFYNVYFLCMKIYGYLEKKQQRKLNTLVKMLKRCQAKSVQPEIEWYLHLNHCGIESHSQEQPTAAANFKTALSVL